MSILQKSLAHIPRLRYNTWAEIQKKEKKEVNDLLQSDTKENPLGFRSIPSLLKSFAIPSIIAMLVSSLYNIVDQIFIANASYLGSYGNAANTVVFPLTVVALAIAVLIGDGCCALVSICLGAQEQKRAGKSIGNAIILCVAASIILTAFYLIFQDGILSMFGGRVNEETFRYSQEYFFYITLGIPCYMFGQAMNPIIRSGASGDTELFE